LLIIIIIIIIIKWPVIVKSVLQRVKADVSVSGIQTQTLRECELTHDALLAGAISDGSRGIYRLTPGGDESGPDLP